MEFQISTLEQNTFISIVFFIPKITLGTLSYKNDNVLVDLKEMFSTEPFIHCWIVLSVWYIGGLIVAKYGTLWLHEIKRKHLNFPLWTLWLHLYSYEDFNRAKNYLLFKMNLS